MDQDEYDLDKVLDEYYCDPDDPQINQKNNARRSLKDRLFGDETIGEKTCENNSLKVVNPKDSNISENQNCKNIDISKAILEISKNPNLVDRYNTIEDIVKAMSKKDHN